MRNHRSASILRHDDRLSEVPHLFKFNDWESCTPELRAQRILNKSRVPDIAKYILDNDDGYLFSSITASYNTEVKFHSSDEHPDVGTLELELEYTEVRHQRRPAPMRRIAAASRKNPALGKEKISVLLFPMENLDRLQQMFSDLNRFAHKTSKSLDILYDHRDNLVGPDYGRVGTGARLQGDGRQGEDHDSDALS